MSVTQWKPTVAALVYPVLVWMSVTVGVCQHLGSLDYCGEIPFPWFSVDSDCVFWDYSQSLRDREIHRHAQGCSVPPLGLSFLVELNEYVGPMVQSDAGYNSAIHISIYMLSKLFSGFIWGLLKQDLYLYFQTCASKYEWNCKPGSVWRE